MNHPLNSLFFDYIQNLMILELGTEALPADILLTDILPADVLNVYLKQGNFFLATSSGTTVIILLLILMVLVGLYFLHKHQLDEKVGYYEYKLHEMQSQISKSSTAHSELMELNKLNQELSEKAEKGAKVAKENDANKKELEELKKKYESLEGQYKNFKENSIQQISDSERTEFELSEKQKEINIQKQQIDDLTKKSAELVQLQKTSQAIKTDLDQKNVKLAQQQQTIQQLRSALDAKSGEAATAAQTAIQTQELESKTNELKQALEIIENQKAQLIQNEKMAALGALAPAIAHEFNNPLGVMKAGSQLIHDKLSLIFSNLSEVESKLSPDNRIVFWQMVANALRGNPNLSSQEERKLRGSIVRKLEDADVEDFETIADQIVKMGLHEHFEKYIVFFQERIAGDAFKIVYEIDSILKQLKRMKISGDLAQKIIDALKGYVRTNAETFGLDENIDNVFILYEYRLAQSKINIIKKYDFTPKINGFPGQLMQVWTNLMTNAEHALKEHALKMEADSPNSAYKPTIIVSIVREGASAVVRFEDNGPGIPAEIQQKVFETLFTTKDNGVGTGYGLSVCQEIMQRHNGEIKLDSEPGRTTFIMNFPLGV